MQSSCYLLWFDLFLILFYQRRFHGHLRFVFSLSCLYVFGLYRGQYFFFLVEQQHAGQQVIALI
jgi:hypothetical protein